MEEDVLRKVVLGLVMLIPSKIELRHEPIIETKKVTLRW
jgi:hypothetical protein